MSTVQLSPVVAGCWRLLEWQLDRAALVHWIEQALALGITSFDHADVYGDHRAEAAWREELDQGRAHGVSAATMAYAWIRRHPARPIPITGSGGVERLRQAVASLEVRMTAEDWYRVYESSMGREVP